MSYRLLAGTEAHWRPSNQTGVLNTDLAGQLEGPTLGARLWRLRRERHRRATATAGRSSSTSCSKGWGRIRVEGTLLSLRPSDALSVEPQSVRQVFNDTPEDQLWLVVGAPTDPASTLEMSEEELRWLYPDGPRAVPPELEPREPGAPRISLARS